MTSNNYNENNNSVAIPAPNLEQAVSHEPMGKEEMPRFNSPVIITITSYRKRKHDPDGISAKAVLDGLVRAGVLADDSTEEIKEIRYKSKCCKNGEKEKTVIEICDE